MPPARATLPPTPGLCKSSRPPAPSVLLPWRAVLLSAPSKHCARRRLLAHTPKAGWLPAPSSLSPAIAPAGRAVQLSKRSARCVGRESNPGQLLGRQLCSPLYHQRYTARAAAGRRPRARPSILSPPPPPPPPPPPHPCPDAPSARGSAPPPAPPAAARRPMRVSTTPWPWSTGPTALRPCGPSLPAAARERLRPHLQRATRGTQLPAPSWPKPFSTGRWARPLPKTTWGHGTQLPARVAALCRAARRGRREPRSPPRQPVGVGAWAAGRPRGPQAPALVGQGRGVAKEALARPWRPCARRPQRARGEGVDGG